jgi:Uma2 family endonuclease
MTLTLEQRRYTLDEYFRLSEESEEKLEYWDGFIIPLGQMLAMAGGVYEHSLITANAARAISKRIEGGPCSVLSSDLPLRAPGSTRYMYPDASVICGPPQFDPRDKKRLTATNPRVVIEVLSSSTEAFDRGEKFRQYMQMESLEEYMLVSQVEPRVESFFRQEDGTWLFTPVQGLDATLKVRCLNLEIPVIEIYRDVEFPPLPQAPPE